MERYLAIAAVSVAAWVFVSPAQAETDGGEEALLSQTRQLTFEGKRAGEGYFAADGRSMIFQSEREPGNPFYQMYVIDLGDGGLRRVSPGHGKTTCGWIHPSGARVMFASTQDDAEALAKQRAELDFRASGQERRYSWDYDETYEIQEYDLGSGTYRNLTGALGYDAEGSYSPDGRLIAFASNRRAYDGSMSAGEARIFEHDKSYMMDIYVMEADGSNPRRLTDAPGYDGGPFFSADGTRIVWRRFSEDGATAEILTMNPDGTDQRQVTRLGAMSWAPYFHPSGDYMIFATNLQGFANFELYMVDAEGKGDPVRVTFSEGFDGLPAFSPDGRTLAWTSTRTPDGTSQIFIASWDDGAARRRLGLAPDGGGGTAAAAPAVPFISAADIRPHVYRLASDEMEGRLTGTPGERLATEYVAAAFRDLGLEPAGDGGTYFQAFEFTAGASLGADNELNALGAEGVTTFALDADWRPLSFSRAGAVAAAPVAFAGYGIVTPPADPEYAYDSYGGLEVSGKWVMVLRFLPRDIDRRKAAHLARYADLQYKAAVARRKGAVGLLVVSGPNSGVKQQLVGLAFDAAGGRSGSAAISLTDAAAEALLAGTGRGLRALQDALDRGESVPGFLVPGLELAAAIDLVREKRTGRNVLARLDSGAPAGTPMLVMGAHVDHLGHGQVSGSLARDEEKGQVHPGADDNASGVAALIEVARHLAGLAAAGGLEARRDILFAAWSGEELGLLGSTHFAARLAGEADGDGIGGAVAAYLNMDMVGRLEDKLHLQGVASSPAWPREIERANVAVGLPIVTSGDSYLPTDATALYLKGVPILSAFTAPHSDYSTPRDSARKINYRGNAAIARLMAGLALSLAQNQAAPEYVRLERPAETASRRHVRVTLGTIPDYAQGDATGVRISGTTGGGPAEVAGLKGGDVIVGLAGTEVGNIYDFMNVLNILKPDETVDIEVLRGGERLDLDITPAARE